MNWSNKRRILSVCFLILASSDCGPPSASVSRNAVPTLRSAYLYGKFGIRNDTAPIVGVNAGILFTCKNQREYALWFDGINPYLMFELEPSRCSPTYYLYNVGGVEHRKPMSWSLRHNIEVEADTAYYLGSFTVRAYTLRTRSELVDEIHFELIDSTDQYEWTTRIIQKTFPHFGGIPTEKMLIDKTLLTGDDR